GPSGTGQTRASVPGSCSKLPWVQGLIACGTAVTPGRLGPGWCDRLEVAAVVRQRKTPRSQVDAWLRDLTVGSRPSLGPTFISASSHLTSRGTFRSSPFVFAQGL